MEISRELLNKLHAPDYDRLKSLRRREKFFRVSFCGTLTVLSFALYFYLLFLFYNLFGRDKSCWLIIGFYSLCLLIGAVIEYYPAFFDFLVRNKQAHLEMKDLQAEFAEVEKQVAEQLKKYVQGGAAGIIRQMKRDVANWKNCEHLEAVMLRNDAFVREASEILTDSRIRRQYARILKKEKVLINGGAIRMPPPEERYSPVPPARREKSGWWRKYHSSGDLTSLNIETETASGAGQATQRPSENRKSRTTKPDSSEVGDATRPVKPANPQPSQNSLFDDDEEQDSYASAHRRRTAGRAPKQTQRPSEKQRTEPQKKTPRPGRIFQPSADYYRKVADRRMEIGRRGELFVMEHEKQRLIKEEGADFLNKLEHSSVVKGDGLGYDILSFENEAEIYVEVKTTTGKFSANIFFTENEFRAMRMYKEQYCIYRVYEFDEATNVGQLLIFKGEEMIKASFDFSPRVYVLTRKE